MKEKKKPTLLPLPILLLPLLLVCLPSAVSQFNIFILAGQSNMAGRGGVRYDAVSHTSTWDGVVPSQCQPNPSVLRLTSDLYWVLARDPLHADVDVNHTNGIGPGMAFANAVLTRDPGFGSVGLVPCAVGGTRLREWEKGGFLYEQMVRRAKAAVDGGGVVRAVLWYQGEGDTVEKEDAESYGRRLGRFFSDLRVDLQDPRLLIIQVALASGQGNYIDIVREAQFGIELLNVKCVDARGLPLESDHLHLTTAAQVRLGEMLADAFLQTLPHRTIRTTNFAPTKSSYNFVASYIFVIVLLLFSFSVFLW